MKALTIFAVAFLVSSPALANCFGSGTMYTCTDDSGNTYQVSKLGNMTTVNGSGPNGNWSQQSQTYGNTTTTNGTAVNGANWNETQTNYGNGMGSVYGTNSQGQAYNHYCTAYGCN